MVARYVLSHGLTILNLLGCFVVCSSYAEVKKNNQGVAEIDFNQDIRPILSNKCFFCHGPDENKREGGLRLDTYEGATDEHDGIRAVVPGLPEQSELFIRIMSSDEDDIMPPPESNKSLSPHEKELLKKWIKEGATYSKHWAYEFNRSKSRDSLATDLPSASETIDLLIDKKLESKKLTKVEEASATALARRLYFDLIGLPAKSSEVDKLNEDPSGYYELLVDKLLASEHFGERLAMYWLDLVRYADTVGYHGDQDQNISPYRDYVIDSFNHNIPLDQFSMEQLAGDLLESPTIDQKIATGYNRLLQTSHEGGVQPKEYLSIYAADRVRNFSSVWMGATIGCAQCHDHKYDPFTMKDFYSIAAFFADIDEDKHFKVGSNSLPTKRPPELDVIPISSRRKIANLNSKLENEVLSEDEKDIIINEIADLESKTIRTMVTVSKKPREIRVLPRGNWLDESGPIVLPAIPEFFGTLSDGERRQNRKDLAEWLFRPESDGGIGELTSRVFVNRIWYLLFDQGISPSLDDFGGQGVPPSNPELLDFLAIDLMDHGWNIKRLIKNILMTRAYKRSSIPTEELMEQDPENMFFARQSRFRIPAESVRDTALKLSGLLVTDLGPNTAKPYQPDGYYRHLNFPTRKYKQSMTSDQWRRGVYVHWQRQFLHPMLKAFDAPSREECTAKRPKSNTPLSSLTLLNDPVFLESARHFAEKGLKAHPNSSDQDRIQLLFKEATSRKANKELPTLNNLLNKSRQYFKLNPQKAKDLMSIGISAEKWSGDFEELASWTQVTRAILNLNETYQRN